MTRTIWKFTFWVEDKVSVEMPAGAELLEVMVTPRSSGRSIDIWAICNPLAPMETMRFRIFGTGFPIHMRLGLHVATVRSLSGDLVWHIFHDTVGNHDESQRADPGSDHRA